HIAFPLHLLFCPKQGRYHTNKADLLIFMLTQLKDEFDREGIDITQLPLTLDSAFVSQELRQRLHQLGFTQIIIAGKGNYVFTIHGKKQGALAWKKAHSTRFSGKEYHCSSKASRREDLQVEEPVACRDCASFDFY